MKHEIGRIEYMYVVFDTIQLDLNVRNNVCIDEGDYECLRQTDLF